MPVGTVIETAEFFSGRVALTDGFQRFTFGTISFQTQTADPLFQRGDQPDAETIDQIPQQKISTAPDDSDIAGQKFFDEEKEMRDASGNILKKDIGILLKDKINAYCKAHNVEVSVKYFDLGYTIRSIQAEGSDAVFCGILAQNAVHAAMSGRTDMIMGHWAGKFTHVPISLATRARKKIQLDSPLWTSVKSITIF